MSFTAGLKVYEYTQERNMDAGQDIPNDIDLDALEAHEQLKAIAGFGVGHRLAADEVEMLEAAAELLEHHYAAEYETQLDETWRDLGRERAEVARLRALIERVRAAVGGAQ